ncbi:hypothetical protein VTI74DRAFT_9056 [Chaetomium olivicolor]
MPELVELPVEMHLALTSRRAYEIFTRHEISLLRRLLTVLSTDLRRLSQDDEYRQQFAPRQTILDDMTLQRDL